MPSLPFDCVSSVGHPVRFAISAELLANRVADVARSSREGETGLIGPTRTGLDPLGTDPAIPDALGEDLECPCPTRPQPQMVGDCPGGGEWQTIAARKSPGLVEIGIG